MGSAENFCLRWNDFESNVSGYFRELRDESDFFDVTLACGDGHGRTLQAHRVILSACSPLFRRMLRDVFRISPGSPSPLLYLRGVRHKDLRNVLDFMYDGEVNVPQADLNSFLTVAEDLQVKGLAQNLPTVNASSKRGSGAKKLPPSSRPGPASKKRKMNHVDQDGTDLVKKEVTGDDEDGEAESGGGGGGGRHGNDGGGFDDYEDSYGYEEGDDGGGGFEQSLEEGTEELDSTKGREDTRLNTVQVLRRYSYVGTSVLRR